MADPIKVETLDDLGLATVMARKGVTADAIGAALGVELIAAPRVSGMGTERFIGTGPDTWLALREAASPQYAIALAGRLAGLASVANQSSSYCVLRLSGASARTVLQRGAAIDLHDDAFPAGSAATTVISHIGVIIWRPDHARAYHVAFFRSFASSFRWWLAEASCAL